MNIAILTRADYRSPRILAESLKLQLEKKGVYVEIFANINFLNRLVSFRDNNLSLHFWLKEKADNLMEDTKLLKKLKQFDAVVVSECSPNAFWKSLYNIEKFRKIIHKPVLLYEAYFLSNAPSQIVTLKKNGDALQERYDLHLSISEVTETKTASSAEWYPIGICAKSWNLAPMPKREIIAIVDFVQPGYESYREIQIRALNKVGIKYISLEKAYSFEEIRAIYQQASIFFIQFPEAFGLSILECLCCGCQIFTQFSAWAMSWRLDENPVMHERGILPDCFTVYKDEEQLVKELQSFVQSYDLAEQPKKVFQSFLDHYPSFYYGNETELLKVMNIIEQKSSINPVNKN